MFLYLASQSPRRRQILSRMGIRFRVVPSSYHERRISYLSPAQLVVKHALGKVRKAVVSGREAPVLGADTMVYRRKKFYGKPRNLRDAARMLRELSGKTHSVYTGLALRCEGGRIITGYMKTRVTFKTLNRWQVRDYLRRVHPLDKAGSYAIQEGRDIVRKVEGSLSNVVGLPEELLQRMMRRLTDKKPK